MKKLIISALAALALVFGVTSCSGDLHDDVKVDPNAMQGYWSYSIFTASEAASGKIGVIASSNSGSVKSGEYGKNDIFPIAAENITYIIWDGKAGSTLSESTRTDGPTASDLGITLDSDEFAICIFTPSASCDLWVYDSESTDTNLSGGTWPGVTTTATVQVEKVSYSISGIKLIGYTATNAVYFLEAWIPNNAWGPSSPNKVELADEDGNYVLTFSNAYTNEIAEEDISSTVVKIQIVDSDADESAFWTNKVEDGSNTVSLPTNCNGKTYTLVVTYSTSGNTVELVEN